jgi:NAD-dependent SIR2 family protein deacetylase
MMTVTERLQEDLTLAASAVREATAVLITAGAGMGVDSGLPDFRGPEGFWAAYPAYRQLGLRFEELANPSWFESDPELAWGFYGHRLGLYRRTIPHAGFLVLRRWADAAADGGHVFTSNVDGQFQRAGFPEEGVLECHGSLQWLQCLAGCGQELFPADTWDVDVDPVTFRARGSLPICPACRSLARPNVWMFGDGGWDAERTLAQEENLREWLAHAASSPRARLVIVECGAGTGVPTVRLFGEKTAARLGATLLRINLREPAVALPRAGGLQMATALSLPMGAREGLFEIDRRSAR